MAFEIVRSVDEDAWRGFLDQCPDANVFHTPEMFAVYGRATRHEPQLWAALDGQGRISAMFLPVRVTLVAERLAFSTSRNIAYGGVLYQKTHAGEAALDELLEAYLRQTQGAPLLTELRNVHDVREIQHILEKHRFGYEDQLNYLIDLNRPLDAVLGGINRRVRKGIRSELRRGRIEIVELERREQLCSWYRLLELSFRRAGVPLADVSLFEAAYDVLRPAGMIRFLLARCEGRPLACTAELYFKKSIYGWFNGMDRSTNTYNANDLIMWHVLQQGVVQGYHVYDFGGAGPPGKAYGVRDYKSKFGGMLVNFGRNTRVHRPAMFLAAKVGYACSRRFLFGAGAARGAVTGEQNQP